MQTLVGYGEALRVDDFCLLFFKKLRWCTFMGDFVVSNYLGCYLRTLLNFIGG